VINFCMVEREEVPAASRGAAAPVTPLVHHSLFVSCAVCVVTRLMQSGVVIFLEEYIITIPECIHTCTTVCRSELLLITLLPGHTVVAALASGHMC
jgi:hypothetical protein